MYFFVGQSPHSAFRLNKLLKQLQQMDSNITALTSTTCYIINSPSLSSEDIQQLEAWLQAKSLPSLFSSQRLETQWVVMPRPGTLSAWSSKAMDIAQCCQLPLFQHIECGTLYRITSDQSPHKNSLSETQRVLYDPLTEQIISDPDILKNPQKNTKETLKIIGIDKKGNQSLQKANQSLGLNLNDIEIDHLKHTYQNLKQSPTDAELMMFSQVNSEHCRHKIFNANWTIDDREQAHTLFQMIRHTMHTHPNNVRVAYDHNAAVLSGHGETRWLMIDPDSHHYYYKDEPSHIVFKVETHNHPTGISPFPGAATGSGGEIRDEAATGRGAQTKAGLCGFATGHLNLPDLPQPWELDTPKPPHLASALDIMMEGPIGAAAYNNEFGRPNLTGFFRTFESCIKREVGNIIRSYYKPIMLAGGIGTIRDSQIQKQALQPETQLIVLGGPAMRIGIGGGSASSRSNQDQRSSLDFASVQRSNPHMQRKAQEVINCCWRLGDNNPIVSIHDVGAGGLSNALPELIHADKLGAQLDLQAIPNAQPDLSPMEIWCNEAQERYVLAIAPHDLSRFDAICQREQCPYAVIGTATAEPQLTLHDQDHPENTPINLPMSALFEDMPPMHCDLHRSDVEHEPFDLSQVSLNDAISRVLQFPAVGDKSFLITISDRSVGGLVARDQMVGPWQIPVADVAVTHSDFIQHTGEAFALGERTPVALLHPAASARMAIGEALTNLMAAPIQHPDDISLSANWMAACDFSADAISLYDAVQAVGMELCPALGINIPVGKDSLSMKVEWKDQQETHTVASPISLIVTAAAPVTDVTQTLTPELHPHQETTLLFIDLADGSQCLGGSVLTQVYQSLGQRPADIDHPELLKSSFTALQELKAKNLILAYHDRSDGGLLVTLAEMAFAAHCGLSMDLSKLGNNPIATLFNEELGIVIEVATEHVVRTQAILKNHGLIDQTHIIGQPTTNDTLTFSHNDTVLFTESRITLQRLWSATSYQMQALRDNPECAQQAYDTLLDKEDPGLNAHVAFDTNTDVSAPYLNLTPPKVAILREQGTNGYLEMAAAFERSGFTCHDVHMTDLLHNRQSLSEFQGLAVCGGFSYGDTLGAGRGWAESILRNPRLHDTFATFFNRNNTFTLGICNGCQVLAHCQPIIPGSNQFPLWQRNESEQFEARLSLVTIPRSPSILLQGMEGSTLPVVVSHAEGRATFRSSEDLTQLQSQQRTALHYVDHSHNITQRYPFNPNGSPEGIAGVTTTDGRVTLMMPHPERVFRTSQLSWSPNTWGENTPWIQLFRNARAWLK